MLESPPWQEIYASRGYLAVEGDYIKRSNYGKTLERIAHGGAAAFYEGEIATQMVQTINDAGGVMTIEDVSCCKDSLESSSKLITPAEALQSPCIPSNTSPLQRSGDLHNSCTLIVRCFTIDLV